MKLLIITIILNRFISMQTFKSTKHEIHTQQQKKLGLSCYDDKMYILDDGISTRPFGYKRKAFI